MKQTLKNIFKLPYIITFLITLLLYSLPSMIFRPNTEFYYSLNGPHLPPVVFIIMWSFIYITMSIFVTYYFFYTRKNKNSDVKRLWVFLIINYLLQALYTPLFFYFKDLFLSYVDTLFVFVTIMLVSLESLVLNKKITLLTLPYLLWSIVASVLSILFYLQN